MARVGIPVSDARGLSAVVEVPVTYAIQGAYEIDVPTDGSDVTAAINAQVATVPDGESGNPMIIGFPVGRSEGRYHTEGDLANNRRGANGIIRAVDRKHLRFEGPSKDDPATFYTEAPAVDYEASVSGNTHSLRQHFLVKDATDIEFRHLRVEGSNYTEGLKLAPGSPWFWHGGPDGGSKVGYPGYRACWELEHAFSFNNCDTTCVVEDCEVDSVWGDGVYVHPFSRDISVIGNLLRWTGRQGVAISGLVGGLIAHNVVDRGRRAAIDLEPHKDILVIAGVEIHDNDLLSHGVAYAALGRGQVCNIDIHHNVWRGAGASVICGDSARLTRRYGWRYHDNERTYSYGSSNAPLRFTMTDDISIESNIERIHDAQSLKCVRFEDCRGPLVVAGNDFRKARSLTGGCAIDAVGSDSVEEHGNLFGVNCVGA